MLSLFYKEQRTSGMGLLTTYGFPKAFIEFWKDFTNTESYKSFKITRSAFVNKIKKVVPKLKILYI